MKLLVNGAQREVSVDPDTPLLWVLREDLRLTGTKFGCGAGFCGACTVHLDGAAVRSCQLAVGNVGTAAVTTIEGLSGDRPHLLQTAWLEAAVPQCGYCQPGMIMAAAALLKDKPKPTETEVREGVTNLCRCGTYPRILRAILAVTA